MNRRSSVPPRRSFERSLAKLQAISRLRRIAWGAAALIAVTALGMLIAGVVMGLRYFDESTVATSRLALAALVLVALVVFVIRPALRRISPLSLARRAERDYPVLDGLLVSAVSLRDSSDDELETRNVSPAFVRDLLSRAATGARAPVLVFRDRLGALAGAIAGAFALAALGVAFLIGPDWLRHGMAQLLPAPAAVAIDNPFEISVAPGDARLNAGDDQLFIASVENFSPDALTFRYRQLDTEQWQEVAMTGDADAFTARLAALQHSLEYYAVTGGTRSPTYRLDVRLQPRLAGIELVYHFPEYLDRAPETATGAGDIEAPIGTRVEITARVEHASDGGSLVRDGSQRLPMTQSDAEHYRGEINVDKDGRYRIELTSEEGDSVPVSREYSIVALQDAAPRVAVHSPGRDAKVTSVEEVDVVLDVADDLGLKNLELVLSVNGGEDEIVALVPPAASATVTRTLYLEDRELEPGDLIAYYARARDAVGESVREPVTTDIFFMEIRPFELEFHSADGAGGGGGGGGGGQQQEQLAAQQRMLLVALFNAVRDASKVSAGEYRLRLEKIREAQTRIRDRVDALVRRLKSRGIVTLDPGYQQMTEEMPKASAAMREVETQLEAGEGRSAQTPARTALLHLQRAEAAFRSVRVARADSRGNSTGDLRNLFRLEMDRFRNQYADVRRGQWQARQEPSIDKTLEALRELARRQEREVDRAQNRSAGRDGESQRELAERVERMARELERLALDRPELRAAAEQMRQTAQAMRDAAAGGNAEASRRALRQLRDAQRRLDEQRPQRLRSDIARAREDLRAMENDQQRIREQLAGQETDETQRRAITERKIAMSDQVRSLGERLAELEGRAQQPDAQRDLRSARSRLQSGEIDDLLRRSRRALSGADGAPDRDSEAQIARALDEVGREIERARDGVGASSQQRTAEARARIQQALRDLNTAERGAQAGGFGGGADNGNRRGELDDEINLRGALRSGVEALRGIGGGEIASPKTTGDIQAVIDGLDRMLASDARLVVDGSWHDLLRDLQRIEYELGDGDERDAPLWLTQGKAQPGRDHRELVEAYYRALSDNAAN